MSDVVISPQVMQALIPTGAPAGPAGPQGVPGSGSNVSVQDEGSLLGNADHLNFIGAGVHVTFSGTRADIVITSASSLQIYRPEEHGGAGDGATNDTTAFQTIAGLMAAAGGGILELTPGATYVVGRQSLANDGTYMFKPEDIFYLTGLAKPIIIRGNGAKLKYANGLKFGTFNSSGASTSHSLPYAGGDRSDVVLHAGIISLISNAGLIRIENLELDGNVANMTIGGDFGDTGKQLNGDGLFLQYNTGGVVIDGVRAHHCPRDGIQLGAVGAFGEVGENTPCYPHEFTRCQAKFNCRNNVSYLGGRKTVFRSCDFTDGGSPGNPFSSAPKSNFDAESEEGSIRDLLFEDCRFINGAGTCFVADNTDVKGLRFVRSRLDGPASLAAWVESIHDAVFEDCTIFGSFIYADPADTSRAARFVRCRFTDKDGDSATGSNFSLAGNPLFQGAGGGAHGVNVHFESCIWEAHHAVPFTATGAIFTDCKVMALNSQSLGSYTNGVFRGRTELSSTFGITGVTEQPGVKVIGTVYGDFLGGAGLQPWMQVSQTYDPASLADGAGVTVAYSALQARMGQRVETSFSSNLQGVQLFGWVSAANTISFRFENHTGGAIDLASGTLLARAFDCDAA